MSKNIQAVRGMHDILPDRTAVWQYVEERVRSVLRRYGYREIRMPALEKTELFKRSIGEVTDIVEKEMYTFADRNGESLTLRPEGTAGCVRAGIENGLLHNQVHRLWYEGSMFRHERPQKGRYRQFDQIGVETFGMPGPDIEAELLFMIQRMWQALGLKDVRLQINTLGTAEERSAYRAKLQAYLTAHYEQLDEDSRRRTETNPLRVLDSKNPAMQDLIEAAPRLADDLGADSKRHFERLASLLDAGGLAYEVNPRLVRGLDYYCHTVFEWVTDQLGAQGTVCAGGRYDRLVEQLGGRPTSAAGFAMGVDRLVELLEEAQVKVPERAPHAYLIAVGEPAEQAAVILAERLRDHEPRLRLLVNCGGGGFKSQIKRADRSGARFVLVLAEQELAAGAIGVKDLRAGGEQESVPQAELEQLIGDWFRRGLVDEGNLEG